MSPTVSVVVTTYNHEAFIGPALDSVLAQTFTDFELIVVDDGSTDGTARRLEQYRDRARIIRQENQGIAGSRNAGIREASGELLAFLDGDDLWEPDKLECQVAAAREHPESGLIVVDGVQFVGSRIRNKSLLAPPYANLLRRVGTLTQNCYAQIVRRNLISTTSQVMIPRAVFKTVDLSDPAFPVCSDWDLYIRIAERFPVTFLSRKLVRWRYLETSASGPEHLRQIRWGMDDIEVLKKQLSRTAPAFQNLVRAQIRRRILATAYSAYYFGLHTDRPLARRYLMQLVKRNPTSGAPVILLAGLHLPRGPLRLLKRSLGKVVRLPEAP